MPLLIRLLGPPTISDDDAPRRLGGRKPWGVLAVLALERPPTRRAIVDLLFGEADDPFAALRWSLLQVRRALAPQAEVVEEDGRLHLRLGVDATLDVREVVSDGADPHRVDHLLGGELLEGMPFDDVPEFEQWLSLERARISEASFAAVWSAASSIARTDPDRALRLIELGLRTKPFCVGTNELAVDIMVRQNDLVRARAYVEALGRRWERELGEPLPSTIARPLERATLRSTGPAPAAGPLLETARARMAAGDYRGAIDTARRAADAAAATGDPLIELDALVTLIGVLVHSIRGLDEDAKGLIATAAAIAADLGDPGALSDVMREAGYVHLIEANYGGAEVALRQAIVHAREADDPLREGKALTYLALVESDRGAFAEAEPIARDAVERLEATGDRGWVGYALAVLARILLRTGRAGQAEEAARRGVEAAREANWVAILPWPMVMEAEAAFRGGAIERSEAVFSEALTIGAEIQDPCWEGLALRGLALVAAERGDRERAMAMLEDARSCTRRFVDVYKWAEAVILTDLVELEGGADPEHLSDALALATSAPMVDLAERLLAFRSPTHARTPPLPGQTLPQTALP